MYSKLSVLALVGAVAARPGPNIYGNFTTTTSLTTYKHHKTSTPVYPVVYSSSSSPDPYSSTPDPYTTTKSKPVYPTVTYPASTDPVTYSDGKYYVPGTETEIVVDYSTYPATETLTTYVPCTTDGTTTYTPSGYVTEYIKTITKTYTAYPYTTTDPASYTTDPPVYTSTSTDPASYTTDPITCDPITYTFTKTITEYGNATTYHHHAKGYKTGTVTVTLDGYEITTCITYPVTSTTSTKTTHTHTLPPPYITTVTTTTTDPAPPAYYTSSSSSSSTDPAGYATKL